MKDNYPQVPQTKIGKKPYTAARLRTYGDIRDLTLGPTPGIGESGSPGTLRAGPNQSFLDVPGGGILGR